MAIILPIDATTDNSKLAYLYRKQEKLRLWHNEIGALFRAGKIDERKWLNFLHIFKPLNRELCKELNAIKDPLITGLAIAQKIAPVDFDIVGWKTPFKENTLFENLIKDEINSLVIPDLDLVFVDPYEDFTTFTEYDLNNHISVDSATKVSWTGISRNEDAWLYKDYGIGHFGDFEHFTEGLVSAQTASGFGMVWAMANIIDETRAQRDSTDKNMDAFFYGGTPLFYLQTQASQDGSISLSLSTLYYFTIERSGTTGTCKIYSDSGRTTLLDTLTTTTATTTYRYLYPCASENEATVQTSTGYCQNLDIQEAIAGTKKMLDGFDTGMLKGVML